MELRISFVFSWPPSLAYLGGPIFDQSFEGEEEDSELDSMSEDPRADAS